MKFSIINYFLILYWFFFLVSCKKFVEIPPAPNLLASSGVFSDSIDANSAVVAMYTAMIPYASTLNAYSGGNVVYTGLSSDELYSTRNIAAEQAFYTNALLRSTSSTDLFWTTSYQIIYKANAIISGLGSSSSISTVAKNQFIGEAKVVRAYCYFTLINLYGEVPLVTSTDFATNESLPRISVDTIYQNITTDLMDAASLLSSTYLTPGQVRPNKYTALSLLAKVSLYTQQWSEAEAASTQVINSGMYSLSTKLENVFLSSILNDNTEAIWQLIPSQNDYETSDAYFFIPSSNKVLPKYVINSFLLNSFELGDERRTAWLDSSVVSGSVYYYPYKYKLSHDNNVHNPAEDYMVFRLAEQYLIRAEARAELGETGASDDINVIRTRAGLAPTLASSKSDLLAAVYHERRIELFCEGSNRWFDLRRTSQADTVMGAPGNVCASKGGAWNVDWELYPINNNELQTNPYLVENPGY